MTDPVRLTLEVSAADAATFREDWEYDRTAPMLSGGFQENMIDYTIVDGPDEIRLGVEALLVERSAAQHRHPTLRDRQEGEINALRAVLRLIDTGDWHDPPRPLPAPLET